MKPHNKTNKDSSKTAQPKKQEKLDKATLQYLTSPELSNGVVMERMVGKFVTELALKDFINANIQRGKAVNDGDLSEVERMLVGQAHALQAMFMSLLNRAQSQEYLKQYSTYMGLALKAQAQSRATIQALTELKYPRQVIVTRQANIAQQQQVNNASPTNQENTMPARAEKTQNQQNELLEDQSNQADTVIPMAVTKEKVKEKCHVSQEKDSNESEESKNTEKS